MEYGTQVLELLTEINETSATGALLLVLPPYFLLLVLSFLFDFQGA